jgi:hypothetical protein
MTNDNSIGREADIALKKFPDVGVGGSLYTVT